MTKEQIIAKFDFPEVKLWDCNDSDLLTCDDPIEAIIDLVDSQVSEVGEDIAALVDEIGSVTVTGYVPETVNPQWVTHLVQNLYERANEEFCEAYGNPEDESDDCFGAAKHMPALQAVVESMCADAKVWRCKSVVEVVLSPEEVLETLRLWVPEYFETT